MADPIRDAIIQALRRYHPRGEDLQSDMCNEVLKHLDAAGYVVAPKEATDRQVNHAYAFMIENSRQHGYDQTDQQKIERTRGVYGAMIRALREWPAPAPTDRSAPRYRPCWFGIVPPTIQIFGETYGVCALRSECPPGQCAHARSRRIIAEASPDRSDPPHPQAKP